MDNFTGRALVNSGSRKALFEDPAWDDRFDVLMELTSRTKLIRELMGTDCNEHRMKEEMNRRMESRGVKISRPRGLGKSVNSETFLETAAERFEAAYLLSLHFGSRGAGEYAEVETNYARAADKRIEVYAKYRADVPAANGEHRISFETYNLLIEAVKTGDVEVRQCSTCNTKHPVMRRQHGTAHCPACATQELRVPEVEREMEARMAAYRLSRDKQFKYG